MYGLLHNASDTRLASRFPAMLRELDADKRRLGVDNYGLAVTTLEEVFLSVARGQSELGSCLWEKPTTTHIGRSHANWFSFALELLPEKCDLGEFIVHASGFILSMYLKFYAGD